MNAGIIDNNRFAPYGEPLSPVAKNSRLTNSPWGYTGESHDIEAGLVYLRARYYEPGTSRFIQQDSYPYFGEIEEPLTRNLYIYVSGNPLYYIDPSGHYMVAENDGGSGSSNYLSDEEFSALIELIMENRTKMSDISYDPYNWEDQLQDNITPLIQLIPPNIPDSQRTPLVDAIIIVEAYTLQALYSSVYTYSDNFISKYITERGFHQQLEPLFTQYPVKEKIKNPYVKAFVDGFINGFQAGVVYGSLTWISQSKVTLNRSITNADDLNSNSFKNLKNNGVVSVNSSGSNRPLYSTPNSYYTTANGEHVFIYDNTGKLIYDISSKRVKGFNINVNPEGKEFFQAFKLEGAVPDFIKTMFGW
jgi:RHS repeat-associated protein